MSSDNALSDITVKVRGLVAESLKQMKKLDCENIKNSSEFKMDLEFRGNIIKKVLQRLEEEKPHDLDMQNEVKEIREKFSAFQKRTESVIEDLKFIKMLMQEANNRLDDVQPSNQKEPGSSSLHVAQKL